MFQGEQPVISFVWSVELSEKLLVLLPGAELSHTAASGFPKPEEAVTYLIARLPFGAG